MNEQKVLIIGAGLAGSEAALFFARNGIKVVLTECKAKAPNEAQKLKTAAELVCTNSLKSLNPASGHGLLKYEMEALASVVLEVGKATAVPAGDALAVDRDNFSNEIHRRLKNHPNIELIEEEVVDPLQSGAKYGCDFIIIATGPLTKKPLETWIQENVSGDDFYFYDAIAPVVDADSLDFSKLYFKDRYKPVNEEEGEKADYLNAPMTKAEYEAFIEELCKAEKVPPQNFEELKYFEACLPVDTLAERGPETLRFSCMKPVGLETSDGKMPYACVQLRKENLKGSAFNLVGFQTRLTYKEQVRIFKMIPGFENATFNHLGSVHRNSFLHAKKVLNFDLSSKEFPKLYFAGQITGVEGYTESASMGLYAAMQILRKFQDKDPLKWPVETGIGALINYIMTASKASPSSINFGLLPPVQLEKSQRRSKDRKKIKKQLAAQRAREVFDEFLKLI
ncbi:MAG: FADH(2)-oxidizing methylenetetrahydrofolate--tRNA-(uracil(54)-C(5))-methyltransferase TrmFO [Epsilonproteobacteria bacterium]|nr:MAG: FADH(2)-oxidizing methylenetetrahydrofolate--tRNA-(uracil(54)-C(5))-methyltransferase TrmFO [Campylobacterota bacterium]RLA67629.1 MAG: FADH(2)-oxidizing methylenetetrahydrofolate--tRNA-(uracil(54)-C(5))-methyltransferase TrmFO [Campylobacterota bacterium]